jgi:flagellar hook-length control protein FliK
MQKPILPIQISSASANNAPARAKSAPPESAAQFSQALTRQIEQRKPQPPVRAADKQIPPPKTQQTGQGTKAHESKKGPEEAAGKIKDKATAGAPDDAADASAAAAQAAAAEQPVADMLAMVASLMQGGVMAPTDGGARPESEAVVAPLIEGELTPAATGPGMDRLVAEGSAMLEGAAGDFKKMMLGAVEAGQAAPGNEPAKAGLGKTALTPGTATPDAGLASIRARDSVPENLLKDIAISAPVAAPVQQASLAVQAGAVAGDKIAARVGTPAWDNQVGQKIVWMVAGKEQSASLTLNPPDMGPMQVVLSVTNDHATVTFSSATPEVRQALEDAMPKLREMMSESGISLGNTSVNDGSAQQQQQARDDAAARAGRTAGNSATGASGSAAEAEAAAVARPVRRGELPGLVDTFA